MNTVSRKDDITITVIQHNDTKQLEIKDINAQIQALTGYSRDELIGMNLVDILPEHIRELIHNNLEFGDEAHDLANVFSKISKFSLLSKLGREIRFSIKIVPDMTMDVSPQFVLFIQKIHPIEEVLEQVGVKSERKEYPFVLPDRAAFFKCLELTSFNVKRDKIAACLALVKIDYYNDIASQGKETLDKVQSHLENLSRTNLREEDVIGRIGKNCLGLILLESSAQNAKIPLNRIRWMFGSQPLDVGSGEPLALTLTSSYCMVDGDVNLLVKRCETMLADAEMKGISGNTILDACA